MSDLRPNLPGRTLLPAFALALFAWMPGSSPAATAAETVVVMIDHAKIVRLPEKAQTVIVGNPSIADVTVQKNGVLVVTGKSFGATNLLALDTTGNMIAESMIRVQASPDATITVQRGLERETYSCAPTCQPQGQLGDAKQYFTDRHDQAKSRDALATNK